MKNLNLINLRKYKLNSKGTIRLFTIDIDDPSCVYFCTDSHLYSYRTKSRTEKEVLDKDFIVVELCPISEIPVIGLECVGALDRLYLAYINGDLEIFDLKLGTKLKIDKWDHDLAVMSWSPTQQKAIFISNAKPYYIIQLDVEVDQFKHYEHELDSLFDDQFGEGEFVTVGWGRKETQFHGTEGKEAARKKEHLNVPDVNSVDARIIISWRDDSQYFVVSYLAESGRTFKVFDYDVTLQYTAEQCNGLELPICWRPSGTWIAVAQNLPNKYTIALFEKNGLRHRENVLPFKQEQEQVKTIGWSQDSEILAIETIDQNQISTIYLFTISNYRWYLKQTLRFNKTIAHVQWYQNLYYDKMLHVVLIDGSYLIYQWNTIIHHSIGQSEMDSAIVTVIDGKSILMTNFSKAMIPPPMCLLDIKLDNEVNVISFLSNSQGDVEWTNSFLAVDSRGCISIFKYLAEPSPIYKLDSVYNVSNLSVHPLDIRNITWIRNDRIVFSRDENEKNFCYLAEINRETNEIINLSFITVKSSVMNIVAVDHKTLICVLEDASGLGTVQVFNKILIIDDKLEISDIFRIKEDIISTIQCTFSDKELIVYTLSKSKNLYRNEILIESFITSIYLTEEYLLATTSDALKFYLIEFNLMLDQRRIESGGELIIVPPKTSQIILQMPRGNIEVILPRVLSLSIIGRLLSDRQYRKAFHRIRVERINLNIFVDHDPKRFFEHLNDFIEQIDNIQWLNMFISDLCTEDVSLTMYKSNYHKREPNYPDEYTIDNKVEKVCKALCDVLTEKDADKFMLPIITTHVKRNDIERALTIISTMRQNENCEQKCLTALKYLLYLVDVNELYKVALGTYDFQLVIFVVTQSQKDPREYLPFLNELQKLDENYRKYKIDLHLKRYERALNHLAKCGSERLTECLDFLHKHPQFYGVALELYETVENNRTISNAFADHLRINGKLMDACLMYERAGDLSQALLSSKHVRDWRKCILLSKKMGARDDEIVDLVRSLIPPLIEDGKYLDASYLAKEYEKNINHSIDILVRGDLYMNAIYESNANSDLLLDDITTSLKSYVDKLIEQFDSDRKQFGQQKNRLITIRKEKQLKDQDQDLHEVNDVYFNDESDLISDISTINSSRSITSSQGTGKSHRSSKNRRKHERKLLNLKEGNRFEDIALIDSLYNLSIKTYDKQAHVRDINLACINCQCIREGRRLQKEYLVLLNLIRDALTDIWIPEMMGIPMMGIYNSQFRDEQHYSMIKPQQRFKPELNRISWEFEVLK